MVEAGEAAVISGHAAGGMRSGAAQPAHQGGESLSEAEGSDAEARTGTGESCCQEEDESDSEAEPLEATEGGRRAGTRQQRGHEYVEEDEDSDEGGEEEGGDGDADVDQQVGAGASHEVSFDAKSRTKLERVIVVPRVIQKRNDLAMAVIKSNWEGAAELGSIVYPLYKTVGSETVVVRAETPPREALAIQEKVMARLAGLQLFCVGLPEANGNEIRWRLATKDGLVLDFCYQLKQGSVLHWFSKGQGRGPQTVRGAAIDPVIPDEAPAGYPGGKGKFANECTRLAYVYVLSNAREGFEDKVLTLFDCSSFINQSEWTIRHVLNNPHDFSFGWFSRMVDCPTVIYQPDEWRELFISFLRGLSVTEPRLWNTYADRPILELIERLKNMPRLREHRLVKGLGLANKTETVVRAVMVIAARELREKTGNRPWTLTTLRAFVTRAGWLEDLADVYITYVHDTLIVFGQSYDVRYHNEPKIDQLVTRYYVLFEQTGAELLKRKAGEKYSHDQQFVKKSEIDAAPEEEKQGILAGYGGTWAFGRKAKRINPDATLASSTVGWHSKKDIARMRKECLVIGARENDVDGKTVFSPDMERDHKKDARKFGRMERLFRSWTDGSWRKRCHKYLTTQPFSGGFVFKEPLKERAVGRRVQVYFPKHEKSHWGDVTGYDPETEYYRVDFEDGAQDDMVWPQLISYMRDPPKSSEAARRNRLARRKRKAASKDSADVAK